MINKIFILFIIFIPLSCKQQIGTIKNTDIKNKKIENSKIKIEEHLVELTKEIKAEIPEIIQQKTIEKNIIVRAKKVVKENIITKQKKIKVRAKYFNNIWDEISSNRSLLNYKHKDLYWHLKWFKENPDYLTRVSKRAKLYLKLIFDEVKKNNMPYEIALLPIVESAYYPFAYSHGTASGIWQFIPSTGKLYGLKQNFWTDERRDIVKSTKAALQYLNNLYTLFDDWLIAIAAYNSGPSRVQKAIDKNKKLGKPTDFWHLKLPLETAGYVPRLIAVAELIQNPDNYGQTITKIENKQIVDIIQLYSQLDLALISKWSGLDIEQIYKLNPALNRWATPDGLYNLVLPIKKITKFKQKLKKFPINERIKWVRHKIKAGENLNNIAKNYHIKTITLKQVNELKNNKIIQGDYLIIPIASQDKSYYKFSQDELKRQRLTKDAKKIIHIVKNGDSLWSISQAYNVRIKNIIKWNKLKSKTLINIGTKLVIYQKKPLKVKQLIERIKTKIDIKRGLTYTVKSGDSLSKIAHKFKVKVKQLLQWNNLDINSHLKIGRKLKLFINIINS